MTTGALVAIIAAAVILAVVTFLVWRMVADNRSAKRERLERDARDHRLQADAEVARARELGSDADRHRAEAERHAQLADEHAQKADEHAETAADLQERVARVGAAAGRHDERAADLERELG